MLPRFSNATAGILLRLLTLGLDLVPGLLALIVLLPSGRLSFDYLYLNIFLLLSLFGWLLCRELVQVLAREWTPTAAVAEAVEPRAGDSEAASPQSGSPAKPPRFKEKKKRLSGKQRPDLVESGTQPAADQSRAKSARPNKLLIALLPCVLVFVLSLQGLKRDEVPAAVFYLILAALGCDAFGTRAGLRPLNFRGRVVLGAGLPHLVLKGLYYLLIGFLSFSLARLTADFRFLMVSAGVAAVLLTPKVGGWIRSTAASSAAPSAESGKRHLPEFYRLYGILTLAGPTLVTALVVSRHLPSSFMIVNFALLAAAPLLKSYARQGHVLLAPTVKRRLELVAMPWLFTVLLLVAAVLGAG